MEKKSQTNSDRLENDSQLKTNEKKCFSYSCGLTAIQILTFLNILKKWNENVGSEFEVRLFYEDKLTLTESQIIYLKHRLQKIKPNLMGKSSYCIDYNYRNLRYTENLKNHFICVEKTPLERLDTFLSLENGFRTNLKRETILPEKKSLPTTAAISLVRIKDRVIYEDQENFPVDYCFTIVSTGKTLAEAEQNRKYPSYEVEIELRRSPYNLEGNQLLLLNHFITRIKHLFGD